jgi:O-antigen/teichoic acid export membrane protein
MEVWEDGVVHDTGDETLVRHTAVYFVANIVVGAAGFASTAVFTRIYEPDDYGIYVIAGTLAAMLGSFTFTWLRVAVLRFASEGEHVDIRRTALGGLALTSPVLVVAAVAFGIARVPWPAAVGAALISASLSAFELHLELLRAALAVRRYAATTVVRALGFLALGIAFHEIGAGSYALPLALTSSYVVACLTAASRVWRGDRAPFDRDEARRLWRFGWPTTIAAVLLAAYSGLDRLVVTAIEGAAAGGAYGAVADTTRQLILVPAAAMGGSLVPLAVRRFANDGPDAARAQLRSGFEVLLAALTPMVVGLALVGSDLANVILGPEFAGVGHQVMPVLAIVWFGQVITQDYIHISFHLATASKYMVFQALVALGVHVALSIPATLAFGPRGAAGAAVAAEAISVCFGFLLARRCFPLPTPARAIVRVAAATAVMVAVVLALKPATDGLGYAPRIAIQAGAGAIAYGAVALAGDLAGMRGMLRRRRSRHPRPDPTHELEDDGIAFRSADPRERGV